MPSQYAAYKCLLPLLLPLPALRLQADVAAPIEVSLPSFVLQHAIAIYDHQPETGGSIKSAMEGLVRAAAAQAQATWSLQHQEQQQLRDELAELRAQQQVQQEQMEELRAKAQQTEETQQRVAALEQQVQVLLPQQQTQ